jgi:putative MFS transporter
MGLFLDGFDLTIIAAAGFLVVDHFGIEGWMLGLVNCAALIGMFIGSLVGGWLTDRIGRKRMYTVVLIGFVAFAVATAISVDVWMLVISRVLLGTCIGADYAIASVLTAEFGGRGNRGKLVVGLSAAFSVGNVFAYVSALIFIPTGPDAWRWMLLVGAGLAVLVAWLRRTIPESPRWLMQQGNREKAASIMKEVTGRDIDLDNFFGPKEEQRPWGDLFRGVYLKRIIFVLGFWSIHGAAYYGISLFTPQIVSGLGATTREMSYVGSLCIAAFGILGVFIAAALVERLGRRVNIIIGFSGMTLCLVILALLGGEASNVWLLVFLIGSTIIATTIGPGTLNLLYPNELFPTAIRARAVGLGTAFSRIGSVLGVLVFPVMISAWGLGNALWLFVVLAGCGLLICIFLAPETKGKSLEELNDEEARPADAAVKE